jgi:dTDP-4-dehydrorhamnose 3,5-epimerase
VEFVPTRIPDVVLLKPRVYRDARGSMLESWNRRDLVAGGLDLEFVQDNHSQSTRWVLRGLHYQVKRPQGKLVRVTRGAAFDVAVDLRSASRTFGSWVGTELSAENHHMLWIPPGFAHGFLALTDLVDFAYKCTNYYARDYERVISWNDPELAIEWPLPAGITPTLSARDAQGQAFRAAEHF